MIGLLGGTFNPVHLGHLSIAMDVLRFFDLKAVHLLPCHTPVHRDAPEVTQQQRLSMLRLAIEDNDKLVLNLAEIERGGASYMIDTLKEFKKNNQENIILILGTDSFNSLHQWKHALQLLNYCHIVVCQRPNEVCNQTAFNNWVVNDEKTLSLQANGCVYFLDVNPVPCSSSFIRKNSANKEAIAQYLPQPVLEFIFSNSLYASNKI